MNLVEWIVSDADFVDEVLSKHGLAVHFLWDPSIMPKSLEILCFNDVNGGLMEDLCWCLHR